MINKRFIREYGAYNPDFNKIGAEDWEFTLRLISEGRVAVCKKTLARVRKHEDNDSGDHVHMSLGEAAILEYSLKHHSVAKNLRFEVEDSAQKRLISAMVSAFDRGTLDKALDIRKNIKKPVGFKAKIKILLCTLPDPARSTIWKWIQSK
jgi:hypothetical protein